MSECFGGSGMVQATSDVIRQVAVIVVNYGTAELSIAAIQSVLNAPESDLMITIHVVDNDSPGDDVAILNAAFRNRNWGAQVSIYAETDNHGFGRGNNVVLDRLADAPPDAVFLLNPDAEVEPDTIPKLVAVMNTRAAVGAVGAGISQPGTGPVVAAFRFPSLTNAFVGPLAFGPISRLFANHLQPLDPMTPEGPVDWVAGAAVMFRWDALVEVGFFDPDFFLYQEEVELMWRLNKAGWLCWYAPDARVSHLEGAATQVGSGARIAAAKPRYWYDSERLFLQKTASRPKALAMSMARLTGAAMNKALCAVRRKPASAPSGFLRDHARFVLWPLLTGRGTGT
ncbi:MAG: glycosyltransferase family 2 protein [Sedimentitalea sp.]